MLTFGVEIECLVPMASRSGLQRKIEATGLQCVDTGRYHSGHQRAAWKLEADGSLRADLGTAALEIVSPPLEVGRGFEQVEKVCGVLADVGASVNRTCGLHVHISIANIAVKAVRKLAELYAKHEPLIDQLIPPSRRGNANAYCASVASTINLQRLATANSVSDIAAALNGGVRHSKLNLASYWRYSTVEFRHHSGTVDASKIIKWVSFCAALVETAIRTADEGIAIATVPMAQARAPYGSWWRGGRQRRLLYSLLTRPEGVTTEEARLALGTAQAPPIRRVITRSGSPVNVVGQRNGREVFSLNTTATPPPAPMTLSELYDSLALSDEDKAFWQERAQILSRGGTRQNRSVA